MRVSEEERCVRDGVQTCNSLVFSITWWHCFLFFFTGGRLFFSGGSLVFSGT